MPLNGKEKRSFARYCLKSPVKLNIDGKAINADAADYSFEGVKAFIKDSRPIAEGEQVNVRIDSPNLTIKGEVVWVQKTPRGLIVGIKRNDMPRTGSLDDYSLADILIGLQRSRRTGILQIRNKNVIKKVYVKDGDMIFSSSNQDNDRLGEVLLKAGKINLEQYNQSVKVLKETGRKQGAILVRLGYLKAHELVWAVRHQVEEIILSLFGLEGGNSNFEFKEGPLPSDEVIILKLSAANLIRRGIKKITNPQRIFSLLCVPMDAVVCLSEDPMNLFQDIELDKEDKRILAFVNGRSAVKDIVSLSSLDETETLKALYTLLSVRLIEMKAENAVGAGFSAAEVIESRESKIDDEFAGKIERVYSEREKIGYYGILGIRRQSSADDIKRAYYNAAKEFHPDRHFYIDSPSIKEKLNTIFSYITEAYAVLSIPQKRKEYDNRPANKTAAAPDNKESARSRFEEGKMAFKNENYSDAFQLFGQAVYFDNTAAEYHYYYGLTLSRLKRFKEAERAISRALKNEPFNAEYLTEAGHIFIQLGLVQRAKSSFEKAVKIDPANSRAEEGLRNIP